MSYYTGFLLAVPTANKQAYVEMAALGWAMFKDFGALSMVENWGADVPEGKVTSFPMATKCKDDETVVFSWLEWPDRATADAGFEKMMRDPRMTEMGSDRMPFDGARMIWGGFENVFVGKA